MNTSVAENKSEYSIDSTQFTERRSGFLRQILGGVFMAITFSIHALLLVAILPSRIARLRATSLFARFVGKILVLISGCPVAVNGREKLVQNKPAIYIANHTSAFDLLVAMWLMPYGTSGVAKRQILYIPFFGLVYLLSGHLIVNRGNTNKSIESMNRLVKLVKKHNLSIFIWPEGTRSRDGKLQEFKKGYIHLARQTGLPVVPFLITGCHQVWKPGKHTFHRNLVTVNVLDHIDTSNWPNRPVDAINTETHQCFEQNLPADLVPPKAA